MNIASVQATQPLSSAIINRAGDAAKANVVPGQSDSSLRTPEDINRAVDSAEQRLSSAAESREMSQQQQRAAVAQRYAQQSRKEQAELYHSIVTEGDTDPVDSGTAVVSVKSYYLPVRSAPEVARPDPVERDPESLQAALESRIERVLGNEQPSMHFSVQA